MTVSVRDGVDGALTSGGGSMTLTFDDGGYSYRLVGFHVDRDLLIEIASTANPAPDGNGAEVDTSLLPHGVTLQTYGVVESLFISSGAEAASRPSATFTNPESGRMLIYWAARDADLARIQRLFLDDITELDINGSFGFVGGYGSTSRWRVITWEAAGLTFTLSGEDATVDELVEVATALRPATEAEWAAMAGTMCASVDYTPTTACIVSGSVVSTSTG